jgi:hypothetical protein
MKNVYGRLFLAFLIPAIAQSAPLETPAQSFLLRPWAVGQTVTLQTKNFLDDNLLSTEVITYSITGEETVKGIPYFWMEIERAESGGVTLIKKIQVRQPQAIDFENVLGNDYSVLKARRRIQKIIIGTDKRLNSSSEFEIAADAVSQIENDPAPSETKDLSDQFSASGNQTIVVQGGSFKAFKFNRNPFPNNPASNAKTSSSKKPGVPAPSLEAWGSPDVPIWGLVKKISKFSTLDHSAFVQETELLSYAESGAVPKIKENPHLVPLTQQKRLSQDFFQGGSGDTLGGAQP